MIEDLDLEGFPSEVAGDELLVFGIGPHGPGVVALPRGDVEQSNATIGSHEDSETVGRVVGQISSLLGQVDGEDAESTRNFAQAAEFAVWIASSQERIERVGWVVYGVIGSEFTLALGRGDALYAEARDTVLRRAMALYAPHVTQAHEVPTYH